MEDANFENNLESWFTQVNHTVEAMHSLFPNDNNYGQWLETMERIVNQSYYEIVYKMHKGSDFLGYLEGTLEALQLLRNGWKGEKGEPIKVPRNIVSLYHVRAFPSLPSVSSSQPDLHLLASRASTIS